MNELSHSSGDLWTIVWTARVAVMCYLLAWIVWFGRDRECLQFGLWVGGFTCLIVHLIAAFHWQHDWSHTDAWRRTAEQTELVTGLRTGIGVWFNYLFALVWGVDIVWQVRSRGRKRPGWRVVILQAYLAFIVFNATVVFGSPWWWGILAVFLIGAVRQSLRAEQPTSPEREGANAAKIEAGSNSR